jgi:predicted nucleic acid-binding protein
VRICVVDSSFAAGWIFDDEPNEPARALLDRLRRNRQDTIVVPAVLWALELRNVLRTAVRRRRLTMAEAEQRRASLLAVPRVVVAAPHGLGDPLDALIRTFDLTSYDAVYLAVAQEVGLPIATGDEDLAAAAERLGVGRYRS